MDTKKRYLLYFLQIINCWCLSFSFPLWCEGLMSRAADIGEKCERVFLLDTFFVITKKYYFAIQPNVAIWSASRSTRPTVLRAFRIHDLLNIETKLGQWLLTYKCLKKRMKPKINFDSLFWQTNKELLTRKQCFFSI